jgi:hypothetical protein
LNINGSSSMLPGLYPVMKGDIVNNTSSSVDATIVIYNIR